MTNLVEGAGALLSGPAAAGLQDPGEVLARSQQVGHRGPALTAQGRSQRLVNAGQLFSACLEETEGERGWNLRAGALRSLEPARFLLR